MRRQDKSLLTLAITEATPQKERSQYVERFGWQIVALSGATGLDKLVHRTELISPLLATLEAGETLAFELAFDAACNQLSSAISASVAGADGESARERRARLEPVLEALLKAQMPGLVIRALASEPACSVRARLHRQAIVPAGRRIGRDGAGRADPAPQAVTAASDGPLLPTGTLTADRLAGTAELLRARGRSARLILSMRKTRFDAQAIRQLRQARDAINTHAATPVTQVEALRQMAETIGDDALMTQLLAEGGGLTLSITIESQEPIDRELCDMLCHAVLGAPAADGSEAPVVDLSATWPTSIALPRLIGGLAASAIVALKRPPAVYDPLTAGTLLGLTSDGRDVRIGERDRDRHVYVLGATGTGKSSLLLGMILADIRAGKGVVLIDPHGDLFDLVRRHVPEERAGDLVLAHLADPDAYPFTVNALENPGVDGDVWSNAITGELLRLFKRSLWPAVEEAFGPMFEMYYRNAILLLLESEMPDATLLDFPRIFQDDKFRRGLIESCRNEAVRAFWKETAAKVTYHEISLENIAPYIICKFSPFVTNRHLKRVLGAPRSTLDFQDVIRNRRICLVNLAKGTVGSSTAALIGGLLAMRLVTAAEQQATIPVTERGKVSVYLDEIQSFATEHLSEGLEECRKYGLQMVLANQSLGQIDGSAFRSDIGRSVMANCASLLSFRVGVTDAAVLARWFDPIVSADDLVYLPDYTAAARLLCDGKPIRPLELRTIPPVEGAGR